MTSNEEQIMTSISIEEAQAKLSELIAQLGPGEELQITQGKEVIAKLRREQRKSWPCQPGSAADTPHWMAPDFDAPLDDFKEYMQ